MGVFSGAARKRWADTRLDRWLPFADDTVVDATLLALAAPESDVRDRGREGSCTARGIALRWSFGL